VTRYLAPFGLDEALAALSAGARPIAGGTDLVVGARQGRAELPADLVALHRLEVLRGLGPGSDGALRIGAGETHAAIAGSERVRAAWTALADASAVVGSPATRATGTLGGNVANASPAADTVGPLACFEATAVLRASAGERHLPVAELATGPRRTCLRPDELILAFELPALPPGTGSCYVRLGYRRQMEIAVVGACAVVTLLDGAVAAARLAITALAPTVRRVTDAEAALLGVRADEAARPASEAVAEAAARAAEAAEPIDDIRAPADYRRAMARVVVARAIAGAVRRAVGEAVPIPASLGGAS
jgi:CO/xanthine dehydrogenase FAD-binding subunit